MVERSGGHVETGADDISVKAGMRMHNISGAEDSPHIFLCDPHDGRIYQGSLMPSVGPMHLRCGPGVAVRGCAPIRGCPPVYEGRVDVPIVGAHFTRVRAFLRKRPGRGRRVHGSALPYAMSVTNLAPSRFAALHGALVGACILGEASAMTSDIDHYKLFALQSAMAGMSPGQVHEALVAKMHEDLYNAGQASGLHPEHHADALMAQAFPPGVAGPMIIGSFFSKLGHIASSIVSDVGKVAKSVAKDVGPWVGTILHDVQAAVSVIPGLGTAVSDVVAAAESAYDAAAAIASGHPFDAAIHAAYNFATGTIPGAAALRTFLDPVVNELINLTHTKEPIASNVLDGILANVPDSPKVGPLSPRSIAASLAHLLVAHLGVKHDPKAHPVARSKPAARPPMPPHANVTHAPLITVAAKPPPKPVHLMPLTAQHPTVRPVAKGPGHAHAALHKVTRAQVDTVHVHV